MKFEIKNYWTGALQFECELDAKYDGESFYFRLGLAVKAAHKAGASLDGASLDGARLDGARLDGARLDGARLDGARLVGASLVGASLVGARLDGARLDGARLVGARLDGASLDGASLDRASLVGARLDDASLVGASLVGASLDGASLDGARLDGASLVGADGKKMKIVGPRPILWLGPIGSVSRTIYAFSTDKGIYVHAGCFWNTLEKFREQVMTTHGVNDHAREYAAAITMIETHFALWPALEKAEAAE